MKKLLGITCALALLGSTGDLLGQVSVGPQLSYADDAEFGLGVRAVVDFSPFGQGLEGYGSFDYYFPDAPLGADIDYWEINANLAYAFRIVGAPTITPYAGGGLNIAHGSVTIDGFGTPVNGSDTQLGLNLLGGTRFQAGPVRPFAEIKIELEGGEQFVIAGGVLF